MNLEPSQSTGAAAAGAASASPSDRLSTGEASRRLEQYAENLLGEQHVSIARRISGFFWGPIPWIIEAAATLSAVLGHWAYLAVIALMLLINAGVGFWQE